MLKQLENYQIYNKTSIIVYTHTFRSKIDNFFPSCSVLRSVTGRKTFTHVYIRYFFFHFFFKHLLTMIHCCSIFHQFKIIHISNEILRKCRLIVSKVYSITFCSIFHLRLGTEKKNTEYTGNDVQEEIIKCLADMLN